VTSAAGLSGVTVGALQVAVSSPGDDLPSTNMIVQMPYSKAEFLAEGVFGKFITAVADAAAVPTARVTVNAVATPSRRDSESGVLVDFTVVGISEALSKKQLNAALRQKGLREITRMVVPAEADKKNDAALALGLAIGGVVVMLMCACCAYLHFKHTAENQDDERYSVRGQAYLCVHSYMCVCVCVRASMCSHANSGLSLRLILHAISDDEMVLHSIHVCTY